MTWALLRLGAFTWYLTCQGWSSVDGEQQLRHTRTGITCIYIYFLFLLLLLSFNVHFKD